MDPAVVDQRDGGPGDFDAVQGTAGAAPTEPARSPVWSATGSGGLEADEERRMGKKLARLRVANSDAWHTLGAPIGDDSVINESLPLRSARDAPPGRRPRFFISYSGESSPDVPVPLAAATRLLLDFLDYEATLEAVAGIAPPDLGAWSIRSSTFTLWIPASDEKPAVAAAAP